MNEKTAKPRWLSGPETEEVPMALWPPPPPCITTTDMVELQYSCTAENNPTYRVKLFLEQDGPHQLWKALWDIKKRKILHRKFNVQCI